MAAISYRIQFAGASLMEATGAINAKIAPALNQAVRAVAQATAADWQRAVMRAKLWSGEKDAYASSIKWEMTGDFTAVVSTDYKHAAEIETGRPAYDLKRMLDTSMKVRLTKGGKRFLVIPMRSNSPENSAHAQAMPAGVYAMAKAMAPSSVTKIGRRETGEVVTLSPHYGMSKARGPANFLSNQKTGKAFEVAKRHYAWGGRLSAAQLKGAGMTPHEVKQYAGMVRFDTTTPGGAKSSEYMRFRIMMEGKPGWVIPPKPGLYLAKGVSEKMQPKAEKEFEAAINKMVTGS